MVLKRRSPCKQVVNQVPLLTSADITYRITKTGTDDTVGRQHRVDTCDPNLRNRTSQKRLMILHFNLYLELRKLCLDMTKTRLRRQHRE